MKTFWKKLRDIRSNNDGASAVEFAFIAPVIAMVVFGAVETGIFFMGTHQAQEATEDTARLARMDGLQTEEDLLALLNQEIGTPIGGKYQTSVVIVSAHGESFADISVQYDYSLHIPFMDKFPFKTQTGTRVLLRDI